MTLIIIIYLVGYALSVMLGRKQLKMHCNESLNLEEFYATLFFSVLSWVAVIFIFLLLLKDGYYSKKPAPKWFR